MGDDVWGDDDGAFGSFGQQQRSSSSRQQQPVGRRAGAGASGGIDWADWGSLRSAATPTVRPAAPAVQPPRPAATAVRVASRPAEPHQPQPQQPQQQRAAVSKPSRGWGAIEKASPVQFPTPADGPLPVQSRGGSSRQAPQPEPARNNNRRGDSAGGGRGGDKADKADKGARKRDDGFGITPQQLASIKQSFGKWAEGGLLPGRPVTFVSIDPRNLGDACRSLKLQQRLIDADVRAIIGSRQQKRAHEAIDLLEFTKLVSARLVKIGAGRKKDGAAAPAPAPVRAPVPVTIAPWLKKKESGAVEVQPSAIPADADVADFPTLGMAPPPVAHPQPQEEEILETRQAPAAYRPPTMSQQQGMNVAPRAGSLAQQQVDAALERQESGQRAPVSRGWEKKKAPGRAQAVDAAGPSLQEAYQPNAPGQGKKGKSKTAQRKERMNEPATLDTFWGNIVVSKSSQKTEKKKKKKDAQNEKTKVVNANQASSEQVVTSRGVKRENAKKKKMSKLKRIILQERERKYVDQLTYRRVGCVLASRAMKKKLEKKAAASGSSSDDKAKQELRTKLLAADVSCYLMANWLIKKRKQMLAEIESLKGMKSDLKPSAETSAAGSDGKAAAAGKKEKALVIGGQGGGDSATEDSATEDDEPAVNAPPKVVVVAAARPSNDDDSGTEDSGTEDSATEDSATEDEDEDADDTKHTKGGVVLGAERSPAVGAADSATEDSATEDDEPAAGGGGGKPAESASAAPEPEPEKYRPRVELSARPQGILRVTLGNLPQAIRWPKLKALLLERNCGPISHSRLFDDDSDEDGSRRCVVNFEAADAIDVAIALMGVELLPGRPVKVDYNERRGPWEWLPEPKEGEDTSQKNTKVKKVQDEPIETQQQAAERRLKIPRIAPPERRAYCQQSITPELNKSVSALLAKLKYFQERLKATDPVKAKMRRRFVLGLREVRRGVMARKVKAVIMTPNIEQVETKGGLDTFVSDIIRECAKNREEDDPTIEMEQIPVRAFRFHA